MRQLNPLTPAPPATHYVAFCGIRDKKKLMLRRRLKNKHVFISNRFQILDASFAAHTLNSISVSPCSAQLRNALLNCYEVSTKGLKALKSAIEQAQPLGALKYCPMCGITKPKTKDHYFPSSQFPEYSVHGLNLVPVCNSCNQIKGNKWTTATSTRMFLHAFSDPIPAVPFVTVQLIEDPQTTVPAAKFALVTSSPANVPAQDWALIKSHVDELHLIARYDEEASEEISQMVSQCWAHRNDNGGSAQGFINQMLAQSLVKWGPNHWRNVLWAKMAAHPNLNAWQ